MIIKQENLESIINPYESPKSEINETDSYPGKFNETLKLLTIPFYSVCSYYKEDREISREEKIPFLDIFMTDLKNSLFFEFFKLYIAITGIAGIVGTYQYFFKN